MKSDRHDRSLEVAVNRGLAAALLIGTQAGVQLMRESRVPADVVARVILEPTRRRATDWQH